MSCPECHAPDHMQKWDTGFPGGREEPEEPACWHCDACGNAYGSQQEMDAARADDFYDDLKQRELEEAA